MDWMYLPKGDVLESNIGIVNVTSPTVNDEIHAPMGGVRDSGWGLTGPDSLKEFQDVIFDQLTQRSAPIPILNGVAGPHARPSQTTGCT